MTNESTPKYFIVDDLKFFFQGLKDATLHIFTYNYLQPTKNSLLETTLNQKEEESKNPTTKIDPLPLKFRSVYQNIIEEKIENQNNIIYQLNFKCFQITLVPFIVLLILDFLFLPLLNFLAQNEPNSKIFYEFAKIFRTVRENHSFFSWLGLFHVI